MKTFIIAELGINHNGDICIVKQLINMAKRCGCDAVKFQKRTINEVYTKEFLDSPRVSPWGSTQRDQKEGLELGLKEYQEIDGYCKSLNIPWFASAWDVPSQRFLQQFNLKFNKIASAMIVYEELLIEVAKEGKPTFISTGMSDLDMIDNAVRIFRDAECPFELMHCVSTYPMAVEDANLKCIKTLENLFQCLVGYSGHEDGLAVSYAAVALGAASLERHITLNRTMYGSDQIASLAEAGLKMLVGAARKIEKAIGNGGVVIQEKEKPIAKKLRAHIRRK